MTQPPTPRGPLGQLIENAKLATGKQWRTIEHESGLPLSSIQSWISGRTEEPSLRGLLHLTRYLGIPDAAVVDAALQGYMPPLKATSEPLASAGRATREAEEAAREAEALAGDAPDEGDPPRDEGDPQPGRFG